MPRATRGRFKTAITDVGSLLLIWLFVPAAILLIGAPIALVIQVLLHIGGVR
jgi:uncharacterized membrane protein